MALQLYRILCGLGAKLDGSVLTLAAGAGHVEVVREVLGSGLDGLNPKRALLAALRNAKNLERTRELVKLLEGAGAAASSTSWLFELVHNGNDSMAGILLQEFGLRRPGDNDGLLASALSARNCNFAHELLNAGARPLPHALLAASKTGDTSLFERVLRSGACAPRDPEVLLSVVQWGRGEMLTRLLDAAGWRPEELLLLDAMGSACRYGRTECAEALLCFGVDPVAAEALEAAAHSGSPGLLRLLLDTGRYAAAQPALGAALEAVCSLRHTDGAEVLLQAGVDPASTAALRCAVLARSTGLVRTLLGTGRFPPGHPQLNAALVEASSTGQVEAIEVLLDAGAKPCGALLGAVYAGRTEAAAALLASGCFPPCASELRDALSSARRSGHVDVIQVLLRAGADPTPELPSAALHGHTEVVKALLATGRCAPEHAATHSALAAACRNGHLEVVQVLLDAGVQPRDCLAAAASAGRMAIVRMLLATGRCPPNGPQFASAYASAFRLGCLETVQALLVAGAKALPMLPWAASNSTAALVRLLLGARRGQDELEQNRLDAALWLACYRQYLEMVEDLLAAGADPACVVSCPAARTNPEIRATLVATGRFPALPETTDAADGDNWMSELNKLLVKAGCLPVTGNCATGR